MIVRMCQSRVEQEGRRVQRVKPLRTRKPRERLLSVAQPQFDPGASKPSDGEVGIECESLFRQRLRRPQIPTEVAKRPPSKTERNGVIFAEFHGKACKATAVCYLPLSFDRPIHPLTYRIAPRSPGERGRVRGVEAYSSIKQIQRRLIILTSGSVHMRRPAEDQVVCIQTLSRLAGGSLHLRLLQLWCDCTDDTGCHLVLKLKHLLKLTVEVVRPQVRSRRRIDKLSRYSQSTSGLSYASFGNVSYTQ